MPLVNSMRFWDIFCNVIDNYGDIGVCWRLAADLASRGHRVRLWVDDPADLAWMAPGALDGAISRVQVLPWARMRHQATLTALLPADVWVEGFGAEPEQEFVAWRFAVAATGKAKHLPAPIWINLEYLTAETYAERSHGLPSPLQHGPAKGHKRWFFYPGFTAATGGLLREPDLERRMADFDRTGWLTSQGVPWAGERLVSLFCYEPQALPAMLEQCRHGPVRTRLLVTAGRAAAATGACLGVDPARHPAQVSLTEGALTVFFLPRLSQRDYDHLLWACDVNFVRGEDSLVRALWSGRAFIWHIYPQHDHAHHAKLSALMVALELPESLRHYHLAWNHIVAGTLPEIEPCSWGAAVQRARSSLMQQSDLGSRLTKFVDVLHATGLTEPKKS